MGGSQEDERDDVQCAPGCCGPERVHYYLSANAHILELEDDYCGPLFGSMPAGSETVSAWVQAKDDISVRVRLKNAKRWRFKDATVVLTKLRLVRLRANGQVLPC